MVTRASPLPETRAVSDGSRRKGVTAWGFRAITLGPLQTGSFARRQSSPQLAPAIAQVPSGRPTFSTDAADKKSAPDRPVR